MKLFTKLRDGKYNFAGRIKRHLIISLCVLLAGIIAATVFALTTGSPLNLDAEIVGGYVVEVKPGANLTDDTYDNYVSTLKDVFKDFEFKNEDGKTYNIKMGKIRSLGSSTDRSLLVNYTLKGKSKISDEDVTDLAEKLKEDIQNELCYIVPDVSVSGSTVTATFDSPVSTYFSDFGTMLSAAGITYTGLSLSDDSKTLSFTATSAVTAESVKDALKVDSTFAATIISPGKTSPTIVNSFIFRAMLSSAIAVLLICIYMIFRFEIASAVTTVLALMHDLALVFAFTAIFHITINIAYFAAIIAVMAISIAKSAYIFARIRENRLTEISRKGGASAQQVANKSIVEAILRSKFATLAMLALIAPAMIICALAGAPDVAIFLVPVVLGIAVSSYSSLMLSPAMWVVFKRNKLGIVRFRLRSRAAKERPAN